ncbi:hypothetical protein XAPC_4358 [Xanthomonas citri pv. punicae str. LMG 859]|nr:hypothetical protein XAPC_4358 [Xanthomonas citri pv. punicae str. LMG 859]
MRRDAVEVHTLPGERVELAIVSVGIDTPEACAADIGQARAEAVVGEPEQAKHQIAVRTGVGHDLCRLQLGLLLQHDSQQDQAVAQRAGHGDRVQPGTLIGQQVVPGDATPAIEVFRVRRGVDGPYRHHKAHAVGGGHVTAAPGARQCDAVLRRHQHGVAGNQRVITHIVLIDPHQPVAFERRGVLPHQRFRAGVAGFSHQHRAQAGGQVGRTRRALGQVREGIYAASTRGDFQQDFRQIDARHARLDFVAQRDQRRWFFQRFQGAEHQFGLVADRLEAHRVVLGQASGDAPVGFVQFARECRQRCFRLRRQAQRAADDGPCGLPLGSCQQSGTRIGVTPARADEHVAAADRAAQLVERAERIGRGIDPAVLLHDMALPRFADDGRGRIMVGLLMQPLQRLRQRLRGWIGVEADDAQQCRQEARDGGLPGFQFGVEHIVGRAHQAANFVERLGQFIAADGGIDTLA